MTVAGTVAPPSMATLQQLFIQYRTGTAADVVAGVPAFLADVAEATDAQAGGPAV